MIKNAESISMAEASEYLKDVELRGFISKFVKINSKDAKELKNRLGGLNSMKIRREHISKIIDLMLEDKDELNKIFPDLGLDEDETKKIFDAIKEYK